MSRRTFVPTCLLATMVCLMAISSAIADGPDPKFKQMVVFGDSLVDVGNVFAATSGGFPLPSLLYHDGRFTNQGSSTPNSVWVELLADMLGDKIDAPTPFLLGGSNFAFGGTDAGPGASPEMSPNLSTQVGIFLDTLEPEGVIPDPNKTLFVLSAGSNNFLRSGQSDAATPAASLVTDVLALAAHGARHFIVPNLAQLGETPAALGTAVDHPLLPVFAPATVFPGPDGEPPLDSTDLNNLATTFNTALDNELDLLETTTLPALDLNHVEIHRLDIEGIFNDILSNPDTYDFNDTQNPYVFTGLFAGSSPNEFVFLDPVHPTAAVHAIIASAAFDFFQSGDASVTVPEPATIGILAIIAVPMLRRQR